ncbi:MAG: YebC/PmpR family DNA-binding transcriptional regulator [Erysipelotrichia bacterium]|nr:YebC/PmpR family DNA-binding transcriptional regulator [Erysipelotrichia bacterium]NCC53956.1 YebC/PmpR family DNA-binding transcriptional regulator [Erysipelotrichia bacterium]
MGRHFEVRAASMAKTAAAKAKVYSKHSKEIYVAAKNGVPDPEMNTVLKQCIDKAKANQVPADVIKRAIEKAKGGAGEDYSSATYEGFGAGGKATIVVECLSDNANRTIADLRGAFNKAHAKIGVSGSVSFNYESVGMLVVKYTDEDAMLEALLMADVDVKEISVNDGEHMEISVAPQDLYKAKEVIDELIADVTYEVLEQTMIPNEYVTLEGEDKDLFARLLTLLDAVDDVQNVYHNVENL